MDRSLENAILDACVGYRIISERNVRNDKVEVVFRKPRLFKRLGEESGLRIKPGEDAACQRIYLAGDMHRNGNPIAPRQLSKQPACGGGLFATEKEILLNHRLAEMNMAEGFQLPKLVEVKPLGNHSGWGEDSPICDQRLNRDGK